LAGITNVVRLTDELCVRGENRSILRFDPVVFDPAALAERAREFRVDGWKARVDLTLRPSQDVVGWLVPAADVTVLDGDERKVTGFSVTVESRRPMDVDRLESSLVRAMEGHLWNYGLACAHDLEQVGRQEHQPDGSVVVPYALDVYPMTTSPCTCGWPTSAKTKTDCPHALVAIVESRFGGGDTGVEYALLARKRAGFSTPLC